VSRTSRSPAGQRRAVRLDIYLVGETLVGGESKTVARGLDAKRAGEITEAMRGLDELHPTWVKVAVALALGLVTMMAGSAYVVTVVRRSEKPI